MVGGHLEGQLPLGCELRGERRQDGGVVRHPLERGVGEDDVNRLVGLPLGQIALVEAHPVAGMRGGLVQHRRRRVDADGRRGPEMPVELGRQLARAAPEVDDRAAGHWRQQPEQVVERPSPLRSEPPVLVGIPRIHGCHAMDARQVQDKLVWW